MKRTLRYGGWLAAAVVVLGGCSQQLPPGTTSPTSNSESDVRGADAVPRDLLRPDQLPAESAKAADGDAAAADRVVSFYAFTDPKNENTDFWLRVAIENGSAPWIELYAQQLAVEGGADRCRRALYLMRRAIELQPDHAQVYSARLEDLKSRPACESLSLSAAGAAEPVSSSRVPVEVWRFGDIGSTLLFAEAVEAEVYESPRFTRSAGKKPGTLMVTVASTVERFEIGPWVQSWYRVEFADEDGKNLGTSSGACWTEELAKCAKRVREDAELAALRMSGDVPSASK